MATADGVNEHSAPAQQHGVLVLNKPVGPTSAGCLEQIKRRLKQKKIGHAGTLDPLASGVLPVLLGEGAKLSPFLSGADKVYSGEFELGLTTDTYDIQGEVTQRSEWDGFDKEAVQNAVLAWNEVTEQQAPPFSAVKHKGKPLYKLARAGEDVPVKIRSVRIFNAELLDFEPPRARFRVGCSSGTYIRSLVHSLGMRLGSGAVMTALTREESRPYTLEQAVPLDDLLDNPALLKAKTLSLAEALPHWPKPVVDSKTAALVRNGGRPDVADTVDDPSPFAPGAKAMLLDESGTPLALVEAIEGNNGRPAWAIIRGFAAD